MTGGSDKRQRNRQILVRLSDDEFSLLADRADRAGLPHAAFMRAAAFGTAGPRAQRRPPADHVALRRLLGELARVGNNINQIARALNAGDPPDPPELRDAMRAYLDLRDAIFAALNMQPSKAPGDDHQGQ